MLRAVSALRYPGEKIRTPCGEVSRSSFMPNVSLGSDPKTFVNRFSIQPLFLAQNLDVCP
jgi:hypothetical protein